MKYICALLTHKLPAVFVFITLHITLGSTAQPGYWQQRVNYRIDISLNDKQHSLVGFARLVYHNQSPDTLRFIWFHLWPNAFKNDKTAFSEQLLKNGRTDFYFSKPADRGYINRLDFKVNNTTARTEDHPNYIDITKLLLPAPLAPGDSVTISTPFHVQLPLNFSRGGHKGQSYQVTQWYPKPAVYDAQGWHEMPYLDQGEFYNNFGNYEVHITLPKNYWVAATGDLQNDEEKIALREHEGNALFQMPNSKPPAPGPAATVAKPQKTNPKKQEANSKAQNTNSKNQPSNLKNREKDPFPPSAAETKTLVFTQNNVTDFAWFADKRFLVKTTFIPASSGRIITCRAFYLPQHKDVWQKATGYMNGALLFRNKEIGEYPFNTATVVDAFMAFSGGMEYPTITSIWGKYDDKGLDMVIEHELGHNWFQGILASNERRHPWMDEGMNSYYDKRYEAQKYPAPVQKKKGPSLEMKDEALIHILAALKKDQPIETASQHFTQINYGLIGYGKAAQWMQLLEQKMGRPAFDSMMQAYYRNWQFKHPQPQDFDSLLTLYGGGNAASLTALRQSAGAIRPIDKTNRPAIPPVLPALGYNFYDGFMAGGIIHNYNLPVKNYRIFLAPVYGFKSKQLNGWGRLSYNWYPKTGFYRIDAGVAAARFTKDNFEDSRANVNFSVTKIAPFIRFTLKEKDPLSTRNRFIQLKHYNLREDELDFKRVQNPGDTFDLAYAKSNNRYVNQLQLGLRDFRALYPYSLVLQLEQTEQIIRSSITAEQYFNYNNKDGGLNLRFFAGNISFTGGRSFAKELNADRYALNMTGPNGDNDYTYSDYFTGRNEFEGFHSQQMMIRDGAFKFRTGLLASQPGRTSRWLMAVNLTSDIPDRINPLSVLPVKIPIKLFADIGTYKEAWEKDTDKTRFLFDAGLQLSLLKGLVNFYLPLIYSKEFSDYSLQFNGKKRSFKNLSFSINVRDFSVRKLVPEINF